MKVIYTLLILLIPFIGFGQNTFLIPLQYTTIQSAIDASSNGDTLKVSPGIYYENLDFNEKSISLVSNYIINNDTSFINSTIIDGSNSGRVLNINYNTVTVIGFTIRNGNHPGGGGIYTTGANITLSNLNIINNNASDDGGGIHCHASDMVLQNSKILYNNAQVFGGGVFIENCTTQNVHIINSEISNNQSSIDGGGIYIENSIVNIDSSTITENTCVLSDGSLTGHGGGVSIWNSDVNIEYSLIRSNSSETGGGMYAYESDAVLIYNDFSLNSSGNDGGGLTLSTSEDGYNASIINCTFYYNYASEDTTTNEIKIAGNFNVNVLNSIIWGNTDSNISSIEYSNTQQLFSGDGNISADPNFVDINPQSPNYNLTLGSPCINSGNPLSEYNDPDGTRNDMGAYPLNYDCDLANTSLLDTIVCQNYEWNGQTYTENGTYEYSEQNNNEFSMSFDGINDLIEIPSSLTFNLQSEFTFNAWIKVPQIHNSWWGTVIGAYNTDGWQIYAGGNSFNINGAIQFERFGCDVIDGTTDLRDNEWHYISIVIENEVISIFIDGQLEIAVENDSCLPTIGNNSSSNEIFIGEASHDHNGVENFPGQIDNISIWHKSLSNQEIQYYMNCPPTGYEEDLVGYWNFEEGQGDTVFDLSGNGNDGIINGATYSTDFPELSCQLTTVNGCDSVAVLNLTITQPDTSYVNITACNSYTWNNSIYTESGAYSYTGSSVTNNYSMSFDGVDDYIELTDIDLLQDFTISAWINSNTIGSYQNIISKYVNAPGPGGYALLIKNTGEFYAHTGVGVNSSAVCISNSIININQWNHISVVLENGLLTFYLNGQFIYSCSGLNNSPNTSSNTFIGRAAHGMSEMFDGLIDNIEIWDIALSENEIQDYMDCPLTGNEEGLVGYWSFEEGEGNTVYDLSGNGNDGTINGATYSTDVPEQSCQLTTINGCDSVAILNLTIHETLSIDDNTITSCYGENINLEINNENEWRWVTNEDTTIMYWGNGYPNLSSTCGAILETDGFYNPNCSSNLPFVLEFDESSIPQNLILGESLSGFELAVACNSGAPNSTENFYYMSNFSTTWHEADSICNSLGGHLVSINSVEENNFVANIDNCFQGASSFWIGLYYYELDESAIHWSNGESGSSITVTSSSDATYYVSNSTSDNVCGDSVTIYVNELDTSFTTITACESYEWNGETYIESGTYEYSEQNDNEFSMSFDGIDDYIDISSSSILFHNEGVISIDFKIPSNVNHPIFSGFSNPSYNLFMIDNGVQDPLAIRIGSGCYAQNSSISLEDDDCGQSNPSVRASWGNNSYLLYDDQWHNITLVSGNSGHKIYLDGLELTLNYSLGSNNVNIWPSDASQVKIGTDLNDDFNLQGSLDNVAIWSTELNQQEVQQYMNCPPTGNEAGLIGYWNFEEGNNNIAFDQTANGNDGTINGATFDTDVPSQSCQLTTINGCDSTAVLNLTILNSNTGVDTQVHCDTYTWIDGVTYTSSNNTATWILTNVAGCDSVVTLDLTINNSNTGVDLQEHCDTYTWIDGNTYTESNNTATFTLINSNNCDSIVTLDLIINNSDNTSSSVTACDEFTWDGQTYSESGEYTNTYTNASGCDSTHTLNLTINNSISSNTEASSCSSYEWNGMIYENSGTYEFDTIASNGCDSTAMLELEICYLDQLEIFGTNAAVTNTSSSYSVQNNFGSTFNWILSQGIGFIASGQFTNEIYIDWTNIEGIETICVVENYDCNGIECIGDTTCIEVEIKAPSSIVENNMLVIIYPNPSSNIFNLEFNSDSGTEILVTNVLGEQVYFESVQSVGEFKTQIDLSNYSKGIYNLTIKNTNGISNHKLILQ